jgi:hypothetical protein
VLPVVPFAAPVAAAAVQIGTADDGIGNKVYINRYDSAIAEKEEDAAYATDMQTPKIPVVINENQRNIYGTPRGYKVQLNRPLLNLEPSGYDRSKALGEFRSGLCMQAVFAGGICRQQMDLGRGLYRIPEHLSFTETIFCTDAGRG